MSKGDDVQPIRHTVEEGPESGVATPIIVHLEVFVCQSHWDHLMTMMGTTMMVIIIASSNVVQLMLMLMLVLMLTMKTMTSMTTTTTTTTMLRPDY